MKCCQEHIFEEIAKIVVDNLELQYKFNEDALLNIRDYCMKHEHKKYKPLNYNTLILFVEEALAEIINCDFLYDFRDIE